MPQEEISCHKKKFPATVKNFLPQEDFSCHKNCQRKKYLVTGRNFCPGAWGKFYVTVSCFHTDKHLFLEEISYDDISFTGRKFLQRKKFASLIEYYFAGKKLLYRRKKLFNRRNCVAKSFPFN